MYLLCACVYVCLCINGPYERGTYSATKQLSKHRHFNIVYYPF